MSEPNISVKFPEEKISKTPLNTTIQDLTNEIRSRTANSYTKLQEFMEKYEKEFK